MARTPAPDASPTRLARRRPGRVHRLRLEVSAQPDDTTCGPTCLHAVYRYYGDNISLKQTIEEIEPIRGGGTLAVLLACHALRRGYTAESYTYNLQLFDPTWFRGPQLDIAARLRAQREVKRDRKLRLATDAYLDFLQLGGSVRHTELTPNLIRRHLKRGTPILTGLSATYLYDCAREHNDDYDDIRGQPMGHFVVLSGYDPGSREALVADPLQDNPRFRRRYYRVDIDRLIGAILLGIVTYDANLIVIQPGKGKQLAKPDRRR